MKRCGKTLGESGGYTRKCGGLWMGYLEQCDTCRTQDLKTENVRLENKILKEQLRQLKEKSQVSEE